MFYSSCFSSSRLVFTCKRNMKNDTDWFIIWKHNREDWTLFCVGHKDDINFYKRARIITSVDVTQKIVFYKGNKFDLNFRNVSIFIYIYEYYSFYLLFFDILSPVDTRHSWSFLVKIRLKKLFELHNVLHHWLFKWDKYMVVIKEKETKSELHTLNL
jgi:hypothetical protein